MIFNQPLLEGLEIVRNEPTYFFIAANERVAVDLSSEKDVLPDGCCMDAEDKLWVACMRAGRITRFDPQTGK